MTINNVIGGVLIQEQKRKIDFSVWLMIKKISQISIPQLDTNIDFFEISLSNLCITKSQTTANTVIRIIAKQTLYNLLWK